MYRINCYCIKKVRGQNTDHSGLHRENNVCSRFINIVNLFSVDYTAQEKYIELFLYK